MRYLENKVEIIIVNEIQINWVSTGILSLYYTRVLIIFTFLSKVTLWEVMGVQNLFKCPQQSSKFGTADSALSHSVIKTPAKGEWRIPMLKAGG